jgi:Rac GTPase-activating protein 1
VCGCLKDFLRGLKESLVTFGLWKDFVAAAGIVLLQVAAEL